MAYTTTTNIRYNDPYLTAENMAAGTPIQTAVLLKHVSDDGSVIETTKRLPAVSAQQTTEEIDALIADALAGWIAEDTE